jgi:hypothetical protein
VIVFEPAADDGTTNVQVNPPFVLVMPVHRDVVAFQETMYTAVDSNPSPETVTDVPTVPVDGEIVKLGITEKGAPTFDVPWVALIVCRPAEAEGTV